jgi:hypothetical protein
MKRAVIKIPFLVAVITSDNRIGFYNGTGFDTLKRNAKRYGTKGMAVIQGSKFVKQQGVKAIGVYPATDSANKIAKELKSGQSVVTKPFKNPIRGSKKRRIKKAKALYQDFTGHEADTTEVVTLPQHDTGLKVGNVIGIMYDTIRDGKRERYVHEFKKASAPALAISHDGQQIYLIGGSYLFKDSGINDV